MSGYKVTVVCSNCNQKLRFPVKENTIAFKCTNCKKQYSAKNGKLINEEAEKEINKNDKTSGAKRFFDRIKTWKIISVLLLILSIILIIMYYQNGREQRLKINLTKDITNSINTRQNNKFNKTKQYFTHDTKELFSLFIESQYKYKDSISLEMTNKFLNTLAPLNYGDSRKFMYENLKGDTIYFYADYELIDGEYKLNIDINEFMK